MKINIIIITTKLYRYKLEDDQSYSSLAEKSRMLTRVKGNESSDDKQHEKSCCRRWWWWWRHLQFVSSETL